MFSQNSIRLLIPVAALYPDQTGGPSSTMYWLCKGLVKRGVDVTLVTSDRGIRRDFLFDQWLETDYGKVIYLRTTNMFFPWRNMLLSWRLAPKADLIFLTSFFYTLSFALAPFLLFSGKKIVWGIKGEFSREALKYSRIKKKILLAVFRPLCKKVVFLASNPQEEQDIKQVMGPTTKTICLPLLMELSERLSYNPDEPYLLYLGRIHPIKGIENLIDALAISSLFKSSKYTLRIAGKGDTTYREQIQLRIETSGLGDKIKFVGHLESEAKNQLLANAYCMILPSFSENFGAVVVESLAQGTPVIASHGTPWQILETWEAGLWVSNSPQALSKEIDKIIGFSAEKYLQYRRNAVDLVEQEFEVHRNVNRYVEAFEDIVKLD